MILPWILGAVLVGVVLGAILGRFAILGGIVIMLLGAAPMAALFIYGSMGYPPRDMSSVGMLSTLILILVVPAGIATFLTGLVQTR